MVEMTEVANILTKRHKEQPSGAWMRSAAAPAPLTVFRSHGLWSSTSATQSFWEQRRLFATHYHELTELEGTIAGVKNYCIAVKEQGDDIVFLRKIVRGGADKSYGIQVAKLAGVPDSVISQSEGDRR